MEERLLNSEELIHFFNSEVKYLFGGRLDGLLGGLGTRVDSKLDSLRTKLTLKIEYNHFRMCCILDKLEILSFEEWIVVKVKELRYSNKFFVENVMIATKRIFAEHGMPEPKFEIIGKC